ncbi:MAG: S-layer homology domain-containing protein [Candidatus Pacebacteria bacterium]|nr:S-layer homology domain-containing protein [Candidatus Paceibacterota bacterium]
MSKKLAKEVIEQFQRDGRNVNPVITMATIEAETNFRNVAGEYAAWSAEFGLGYGQVHLRWHFDSLLRVADKLNCDLPSYDNPRHNPEKNKPFAELILGNNLLSMHLAVEVIHKIWTRADVHDFLTFTKAYVGSGISAEDIKRRRAIYDKWLIRLGGTHIDSWFADSLKEAATLGLMVGDVDGNQRPNDFATRAELATVAVRIVKLLRGEVI